MRLLNILSILPILVVVPSAFEIGRQVRVLSLILLFVVGGFVFMKNIIKFDFHLRVMFFNFIFIIITLYGLIVYVFCIILYFLMVEKLFNNNFLHVNDQAMKIHKTFLLCKTFSMLFCSYTVPLLLFYVLFFFP